MSDVRMTKDGVLALLNEEHQMALDKIECLDTALVGLQFEGKSSVGRNLKQLRSVLGFFQGKLMKHMKLEEQVIFPFLKSHVPKLDSVLGLLCSQHEDFKGNFEDLQLFAGMLSNQISKSGYSKIIRKLREVGTYLIYLLRHHIQLEHQNVYNMINCELSRNEKRELERRVKEKATLVNGINKKLKCKSIK